MQQHAILPRVGYDNVEFTLGGHRVIATVIGYDDDGALVLWDDVWHVSVEDVRLTDEPLNHPPTDWYEEPTMTTWLVATLARYALVDAHDENEARVKRRAALYDL